MLDGIAAISLCRMSAGPSTLGQSMPSRESVMRLFVGNLMRACLLRATTPDVNTLGLEESDMGLIPQFVQTAKQNVGPFPFYLFVSHVVTYEITGRPSHTIYRRLGRLKILLLGRCHCSKSYCFCSGSNEGCRAVRPGWSRI